MDTVQTNQKYNVCPSESQGFKLITRHNRWTDKQVELRAGGAGLEPGVSPGRSLSPHLKSWEEKPVVRFPHYGSLP